MLRCSRRLEWDTDQEALLAAPLDVDVAFGTELVRLLDGFRCREGAAVDALRCLGNGGLANSMRVMFDSALIEASFL